MLGCDHLRDGALESSQRCGLDALRVRQARGECARVLGNRLL
jgi:hypothetical protein